MRCLISSSGKYEVHYLSTTNTDNNMQFVTVNKIKYNLQSRKAKPVQNISDLIFFWIIKYCLVSFSSIQNLGQHFTRVLISNHNQGNVMTERDKVIIVLVKPHKLCFAQSKLDFRIK